MKPPSKPDFEGQIVLVAGELPMSKKGVLKTETWIAVRKRTGMEWRLVWELKR